MISYKKKICFLACFTKRFYNFKTQFLNLQLLKSQSQINFAY